MKFSTGKHAQFISDRSGMQFPYTERRVEWNGSVVHISEFERKLPQLEPKKPPREPQALHDARPDRKEPLTVPVGGEVFPLLKNKLTVGVAEVGTVTVTTS